jgi:hypothetical protein
MIQLYDDYVVLDVKDLSFGVDIDYEYISDPPIFVDIGLIDIDLQNFKLFINVTSSWDDYNITFHFSDFKIGNDGFSF